MDTFDQRMALLARAKTALKERKKKEAVELIHQYVELLPLEEERKNTYELLADYAAMNDVIQDFIEILSNDNEPLS